MRRTRAALASLALTPLILTAGCSSSGQASVTSGGKGPSTARTSTGAAASSSAGGSTASSSRDPDGTVGFKFTTGDHVEVAFRIDKPIDMAAADPLAQSCRLDSDQSRALVQHVVVSVKLTSSLAEKFSLTLGSPTAAPVVVQQPGGGQCMEPGYGNELSLSLTPGQSVDVDLWVIGDGAKSPSDPAGDPTILRNMLFDPSMPVGWTDMVQPDAIIDYAFGPLVLACRLDNVHTVQAEIFTTAMAFARGDTYCAPSATRADFAALEAEAGTVQDG